MPDERTPRGGGPRTRQPQQPAAAPAEPKPFSTIEVRVGRLPGRINNIVLNGGRKVKDALSGASLTADRGLEIRVNGVVSNVDANLTEGDTVLLVGKIRGNR